MVIVFTQVHEAGGKVLEFTSFCGGLPHPDNANNPLGYKFSWSPRGVLLAARNDAKWKEHGETQALAGAQLMSKGPRPIEIPPNFSLEGYPNRDSTPYEQRYGLKDASLILRGSLRYKVLTRTTCTVCT